MSHDTAASVAATGQRTTTSISGISGPEPLYGGTGTGRRVTVRDIAAAKARGEKWPMLTAYDALTAGIFDRAGIPVLLVGDSAAMVVYGHDTTIPVTVDDLIPLTAAVVRGTSRALVVADLPFGSYQASAGAALAAATRFLKETGAHAVKLEGGQRVAHQVEELVAAGIPPMPARVFAALLVTDSGRLTAAELAGTLRISPAAVSGAVRYLIQVGLVHKERVPGSRRDYYRMPGNMWDDLLRMRDQVMSRWGALVREGIDLVGPDTAAGARMAEQAAFLEFATQEMAGLLTRWEKYRAERA